MAGASQGANDRLGIGLVFNPPLAGFFADHGDALDYLELSPERFWHDAGPAFGRAAGRYSEIPQAVAQFEAAREGLPVVAHGVGLSLATTGPLDEGHVMQVARWHARYGFEWYSEHLAWFRLGPDDGWRGVGLMMPPVYDDATLADLVPKLARVREIIGTEVLVENGVDYAPGADAMAAEPGFLMALSRQAGTGLLLDLHNLHTNALNHGFDPFAFVDALDLARVREIHIAGGEMFQGYWTDSHSGRCPARVWALLEHVLARPNAIRAVTLEIDESYAARLDPEDILAELDKARAIWARAIWTGAATVPAGAHVA